ncbi:SDR family NAD(P)-dependent oxidoreductase [Sphingomonas mesophila]|uniref:SDR family NAD(P)-dependent oxidoreductase n=1 Tax=Sphingomonas mesophila TaxID=2303576 RepID=UPI000E570E45|nr:SDR family NAD(P)-dependent oxidoreductase [Sphingomonas mesophila]
MSTPPPFQGRLALVTGASRGIGAATAEALAAAGAHVVLVARTAAALEEVEDRIHAAGGNATIAPLDLAERDHITKLAEAIGGRWGSLDLLVLNAAMLGSLSPVEHLDPKELEKVFRLNLFANQALIAAFDPMLRRATRADIVGITSSVGAEPRAFWGGYGASKAALENMLLSYADETAHAGKIRVHIVDPGATRTRMRQLAFPGEEPASLKPPEAVAAAIVAQLDGDAATGSRLRVEG